MSKFDNLCVWFYVHMISLASKIQEWFWKITCAAVDKMEK